MKTGFVNRSVFLGDVVGLFDPFKDPTKEINSFYYFSDGKGYVLWSIGPDRINSAAKTKYNPSTGEGDLVRYSDRKFFLDYKNDRWECRGQDLNLWRH